MENNSWVYLSFSIDVLSVFYRESEKLPAILRTVRFGSESCQLFVKKSCQLFSWKATSFIGGVSVSFSTSFSYKLFIIFHSFVERLIEEAGGKADREMENNSWFYLSFLPQLFLPAFPIFVDRKSVSFSWRNHISFSRNRISFSSF